MPDSYQVIVLMNEDGIDFIILFPATDDALHSGLQLSVDTVHRTEAFNFLDEDNGYSELHSKILQIKYAG